MSQLSDSSVSFNSSLSLLHHLRLPSDSYQHICHCHCHHHPLNDISFLPMSCSLNALTLFHDIIRCCSSEWISKLSMINFLMIIHFFFVFLNVIHFDHPIFLNRNQINNHPLDQKNIHLTIHQNRNLRILSQSNLAPFAPELFTFI